jgi:hypothetical protein
MLPIIGVGLFVGAGIPTGPRSTRFVECGCCEHWHRDDFAGDCRENSERFADPPADATEIVSIEDQIYNYTRESA